MKIIAQEDSSENVENKDGELLRCEAVQEIIVIHSILIPCYICMSNHQRIYTGIGGVVRIEDDHGIPDDVRIGSAKSVDGVEDVRIEHERIAGLQYENESNVEWIMDVCLRSDSKVTGQYPSVRMENVVLSIFKKSREVIHPQQVDGQTNHYNSDSSRSTPTSPSNDFHLA
jgi:hypothetical protein